MWMGSQVDHLSAKASGFSRPNSTISQTSVFGPRPSRTDEEGPTGRVGTSSWWNESGVEAMSG